MVGVGRYVLTGWALKLVRGALVWVHNKLWRLALGTPQLSAGVEIVASVRGTGVGGKEEAGVGPATGRGGRRRSVRGTCWRGWEHGWYTVCRSRRSRCRRSYGKVSPLDTWR